MAAHMVRYNVQWHSARAAQEARFPERSASESAGALSAKANPPCTPAENQRSSWVMASRPGHNLRGQ
eukprot:SAG31_NODE_2467_length_5652_cov_3.221862_2_plen_67_part_00